MSTASFKNPLKPKRTDFSFKSGVFDFKYIREHAGANPFGIEPDLPPLALQPCASKDCTYVYDPNSKTSRGKCMGWCAIC